LQARFGGGSEETCFGNALCSYPTGDNPRKTSLEENTSDPDTKPDTLPDAAEALNPANDQRSLDIGESGQFAPGGYYNQHGAATSDRIDLDEYTATRDSDKPKK
jgi:hypothetical protein